MRSLSYFCPNLTRIGMMRQIFGKLPRIKFSVSSSSCSFVVLYGQEIMAKPMDAHSILLSVIQMGQEIAKHLVYSFVTCMGSDL
jgi:hypothetical protein